MQQKLIILLLIVMVINSVATFYHPAYRFYKEQAQVLRDDYVKFERKVRDDFVPAITNFVLSVPRGTNTNNSTAGSANLSKSPSPTGTPMRCERDATALEKRLAGIKKEIEGSIGFANGGIIRWFGGRLSRCLFK